MTDKILELAREAGFEIVDGMIDLGEHSDYTATESLKAFANLIRQDEREQCAKVCDGLAEQDYCVDVRNAAKSIRERCE
jgi:hypothetical protein